MKKLYKSENNRMIAGVCGGIAEYFSIDPSLVRIATVIVSCFGGAGVVAYIACALILPKESDVK